MGGMLFVTLHGALKDSIEHRTQDCHILRSSSGVAGCALELRIWSSSSHLKEIKRLYLCFEIVVRGTLPLEEASGPWVPEGVCLEHLTPGLCEMLGGTAWGMGVSACPEAANLRYLYAFLIFSVGPGNREVLQNLGLIHLIWDFCLVTFSIKNLEN